MFEELIGFDVGGTKLRVATYKPDGSIKNSREYAPVKGNKQSLLDQIQTIVLTDDFQGRVYSFGFPGPVINGDLLRAPPLHLDEKITEEELKELLEADKVIIGNDVHNAVLAEARLGVGRTKHSLLLITLSTGIGAALFMNGDTYDGFPCEFGHTVLERDQSKANKCSCGNFGCWVAQASGYGIVETARREFEYGVAVTGKRIEVNNAEAVFRLAEEDSREGFIAGYIITRVRDYNAHGIGNIVNVLGEIPIVIMGGLGLGQFDKIIPNKEEIKKYTVNQIPEILKSGLGDDIGLLGARIKAEITR